jgi:hypothetical protein
MRMPKIRSSVDDHRGTHLFTSSIRGVRRRKKKSNSMQAQKNNVPSTKAAIRVTKRSVLHQRTSGPARSLGRRCSVTDIAGEAASSMGGKLPDQPQFGQRDRIGEPCPH